MVLCLSPSSPKTNSLCVAGSLNHRLDCPAARTGPAQEVHVAHRQTFEWSVGPWSRTWLLYASTEGLSILSVTLIFSNLQFEKVFFTERKLPSFKHLDEEFCICYKKSLLWWQNSGIVLCYINIYLRYIFKRRLVYFWKRLWLVTFKFWWFDFFCLIFWRSYFIWKNAWQPVLWKCQPETFSNLNIHVDIFF